MGRVALPSFWLVAYLGAVVYATARLAVSESYVAPLRRRLSLYAWFTIWTSLVTGSITAEKPEIDEINAWRPSLKKKVGYFKVGKYELLDVRLPLARFAYNLFECIACVSFWSLVICMTLVFGFHPNTLQWWFDAMAIRVLALMWGAGARGFSSSS